MTGTSSAPGPSRVLSRDGWGWFALSTLARAYLVFAATLAAIALLPALFGWHGSVVQTGSMEPHISPGDVVVSSPLDDDAPVPVGHVVEFRSPASAEPSGQARNRLHRIVSATGEGTYVTAGDANADVDSTPITRDQIIGQGRLLVPYVGLPQLWINTGNFFALGAWLLGTLGALLLVGAPPPRRRRPGDPDEKAAHATDKTTDAAAGRIDRGPTRRSVRALAAQGGLTAGALLIALGVGVAAAAPVQTVNAAFTGRTTNTGSSWQIAQGVDTRGFGNYRSVIGRDQPWAYYPLDEVATSSTAQDQSGNDRDASYSWFGVTEATGALTRELNRAVTLNGTATATFATPNPVTAPSVFTVELWFKTNSGRGGELASFGNAPTGVSTTTSRKLYMGSNGRLYFGAHTGAAGVITSPRAYNDSAWHHAVATFGAAGMALHVDGQLVASNSNRTVVSGTGHWRFGGDSLTGWPNRPTGTYFPGSLDEIAVYQNTALPTARVQAHYQAALASTTGNYPDEVAADAPSYYYHLDEGGPGAVLDHSGHRQDATYPAVGITHNVVGVLPKRNNRAADFNGTSGSLVSNSSSAGAQVFTVEAWFSTTTRRGGQLIGFANSATSGSSTRHDRKLYMTDSGQLVFGVYPGATRTITTPAAYNDGNWHHAVATLSSAGMRLHVDGRLVASDSTVRNAEAYSGYWHIGSGQLSTWPSPPSSNSFDGILDEVAIYATALSDSQIAAHYRAR